MILLSSVPPKPQNIFFSSASQKNLQRAQKQPRIWGHKFCSFSPFATPTANGNNVKRSEIYDSEAKSIQILTRKCFARDLCGFCGWQTNLFPQHTRPARRKNRSRSQKRTHKAQANNKATFRESFLRSIERLVARSLSKSTLTR
jgi:hypothetical protein